MKEDQPKKSGSWLGGGSKKPKARNELFLTHTVQDQMKIEVVQNVDITPKYKSIYFIGNKNTHKFQLLHGSGHFAVSVNDTLSAEV